MHAWFRKEYLSDDKRHTPDTRSGDYDNNDGGDDYDGGGDEGDGDADGDGGEGDGTDDEDDNDEGSNNSTTTRMNKNNGNNRNSNSKSGINNSGSSGNNMMGRGGGRRKGFQSSQLGGVEEETEYDVSKSGNSRTNNKIGGGGGGGRGGGRGGGGGSIVDEQSLDSNISFNSYEERVSVDSDDWNYNDNNVPKNRSRGLNYVHTQRLPIRYQEDDDFRKKPAMNIDQWRLGDAQSVDSNSTYSEFSITRNNPRKLAKNRKLGIVAFSTRFRMTGCKRHNITILMTAICYGARNVQKLQKKEKGKEIDYNAEVIIVNEGDSELAFIDFILKKTECSDIDEESLSGDTALIIACRLGKFKIVELLIQRGADVNLETRNGKTGERPSPVLHCAGPAHALHALSLARTYTSSAA